MSIWTSVQKTATINDLTPDDILLVVIVEDTTSNPAGTSYQLPLSVLSEYTGTVPSSGDTNEILVVETTGSNVLIPSGGFIDPATVTGTLNNLQFGSISELGLKLNNLSTAQRDLLTPARGNTIYNTTLDSLQIWTGAAWETVVSDVLGTMAIQNANNVNITNGVANLSTLTFSGTSTAGIIVKSLTTAQRNALAGVQNGAIVYDTDLDILYFYASGAWVPFDGSNATSIQGVPVDASPPLNANILQFNGSIWGITDLSSAGIMNSGNLTPGIGMVPFAVGAGGLGMDFDGLFTYDSTTKALSLNTLSFNATTVPGLTLNNLTTAQISALTPALGQLVYDTTTDATKVYSEGAFQNVLTTVVTPSVGAIAFADSNQGDIDFSDSTIDSAGNISLYNASFFDTTQPGLRLNNLTSGQVGALTPAAGNLWYNSTNTSVQFYNGSSIQTLATSAYVQNFGVTVGTGGDYATLSAAFTAGKYICRIISNVTESANYTFAAPANIFIYFTGGFTYSYGNFSPFNFGANLINFEIAGSGLQTITRTTSGALIACASALAGSEIKLNGCRHQDLTIAAVDSYIIDGASNANVKIMLNSGIFTAANKVNSGFVALSTIINSYEFVGGGIACEEIMNISGLTAITDCRVSGTFISPATGYAFNLAIADIKGLYFNTLTAGISTDISFTAMMIQNSAPIVIGCTSATSLNISQCNPITLVLFDNVAGAISQSVVYALDETGVTATGILSFNQCVFPVGVTAGQFGAEIPYKLANCTADDDIFVYADNCTLQNVNVSNGSNATINIQAGANKTNVYGCRTDLAIVNGGTNTSLSSNTLL